MGTQVSYTRDYGNPYFGAENPLFFMSFGVQRWKNGRKNILSHETNKATMVV